METIFMKNLVSDASRAINLMQSNCVRLDRMRNQYGEKAARYKQQISNYEGFLMQLVREGDQASSLDQYLADLNQISELLEKHANRR